MKISSDNWLSKIIGKPAYFLKAISENIKKKDLPKGKNFFWTKISVDDIKSLKQAQKLGFYVVDTNVQLSLSKIIFKKKNIKKVRFANANDELRVRKLAKNAFKYNRFNKDPKFSNYVASKIKEEWVGNFFLGKRGKWMIVSEKNSKINGFLQLIEKNQNTIVIDLIAVDKKNKGKGLAKEMIAHAYTMCLKKKGFIEVGTQIANIPSIKLYLNLGFHINSAYYVLHMHQK